MKRRSLKLLGGCSLSLGAILIVIWVRSYFVCDTFLYCTGSSSSIDKSVWMQWGYGSTRIAWQDAYPNPGFQYRTERPWHQSFHMFQETVMFNLLGFSVGVSGTRRHGSIYIPCWPGLLLIGAPIAAWWWLAREFRRQRKEGRCVQCGYDLRATPGRCPECGAVPANSITA